MSRPGKTKTLVMVPSRLADALKRWRETTGHTTADAVLSACCAHLDAVQAKYAGGPDDDRRVQLGLPPLAVATLRPGPGGERMVQVALSIQEEALAELDEAAAAMGLSRSALVTGLLDRGLEEPTG